MIATKVTWKKTMIIILFIGISFFDGFFCNLHPITDSNNNNQNWLLRIIHANGMHARFDEINAATLSCSPQEKEAGQCYGGFARIATLVRQARQLEIPTLFLNAGDTFQGTPWYSIYKWRIVVKFLNILMPNVSTLGNHEFDYGVKGLIPFLERAKFPIVACNLDLSGEPGIAAIVKKSVVLTVEGRRIGVIGYLTSEPQIIPDLGRVIVHDAIESVKKEVKKLQDDGVNIIIGLGHSGYEVDKRIAAEVEGLDLIIGGHSHSFLYSGEEPSLEKPLDPYPTKVRQKNGKIVYVVQAGAFTKYLGDLCMTFSADGEIKEIMGNPILLDNKIDQAPDVLHELEKWRKGLEMIISRPIGYTRVLLNGDRTVCRKSECNMGNLITDAMIDHNLEGYKGNFGWTDAAIAVHNSGSIRASIIKLPDEPITYGDVMTALSLGNIMGKTTLTGWQILEMLEHSVAEFQPNRNDTLFSGQFLHFSGIQAMCDITRPVGSRIFPNNVYIRCALCEEPRYLKLRINRVYGVIMNNFLYNGGNGYTMFKINNSTWTSSETSMDEVLARYIDTSKNFIRPGNERKMKFYNSRRHV